jgi:hypothetical protein
MGALSPKDRFWLWGNAGFLNFNKKVFWAAAVFGPRPAAAFVCFGIIRSYNFFKYFRKSNHLSSQH